MKEKGPSGHVLLDVDDIAEQGDEVHAGKMEKLRKVFKFGKWGTCTNPSKIIVAELLPSLKTFRLKFIKQSSFKKGLGPFQYSVVEHQTKKLSRMTGENQC